MFLHEAPEAWQSPGINGVLADVIKDGGDLVKHSLLWLFNCMLAGHFPERLSVGLITGMYKSGNKSDMRHHGSVIAKRERERERERGFHNITLSCCNDTRTENCIMG